MFEVKVCPYFDHFSCSLYLDFLSILGVLQDQEAPDHQEHLEVQGDQEDQYLLLCQVVQHYPVYQEVQAFP